jgi:hypothetical protein
MPKRSPRNKQAMMGCGGEHNLGHKRSMKIFTSYEKKAEENYLALVQLLCSITIYRKTILG